MAGLGFIQNIGPGGLLLILAIVLILFGAGKMPQVFEQLGKGLKSFRDAQKDDAIDVSEGTKTPPKALAESDSTAETEEVREKAGSKTG